MLEAGPTKDRVYLSPPHMSGREIEFVQEAFASNWITSLGPQVELFERELAAYAGTKGAAVFNSGSSAIHLALKLIGIEAGDRVFTSSLTFAATANPIVYESAKPVFIDSEPDTWNMSPRALERAFEDHRSRGIKVRAVIAVNLYGQSADLDPLLEICNRFETPLIEDAAESLGATYKKRMSGALGKFGIFSFNGNKIITTSGGGALVSDDLAALEKAKFWATQSRDPARHYEHSEIGYNYRMSNVLAAVGRGQLQVLEDRVEKRRKIFANYHEALKDVPGLEFMPEASFGRSTRWLSALLLPDGASPLKVLDAFESQNIEARRVWKPLHQQPVFKNSEYFSHEPKSISDEIFNRGFLLPSGSSLKLQDQMRTIEVLQKALGVKI